MPINNSAAAPTKIPSKCSGIRVTFQEKPYVRSFSTDIGAIVGILERNTLHCVICLCDGAFQIVRRGSHAQHTPAVGEVSALLELGASVVDEHILVYAVQALSLIHI